MLKSAALSVLALIGLASSPAHAAPAPAPAGAAAPAFACPTEQREAIGRALQAALDKATAAAAPRAALLRVQCGKEVWNLAGGVADVASGRPARADDRFRAGSILKPAIAAVVLQLVEEGKLSLDDPITRRLPPRYTAGFKDADAITVSMLLNHTSGIGEWLEAKGVQEAILANPGKVWSPEDYIALAVGLGPKFRPGEGYAYNNTEYVLLGLLIEQAAGKPWREAVRERIFAPVSIPAAALPSPGAAPDLSRHIHGYMTIGGREHDVSGIDPSMADAAGGHAFAPTPSELARFLDHLLAGRYFKRAETLAAMTTFRSAGDTATSAGLRNGYGLGLGQYSFTDGTTAVGHTGGTAGYSSFVLHVPELGAVLSGAVSTDDPAVMARLGDEARRVLIEAKR